MAITKVGTYRNPPVDITDYEAIVAHLDAYTRQVGNQGMILTEWTNTSGTPAIAMGSYISHGGVLYVVSSEEAVSLPVADGTYYLKVAASGDTLALSWISDLSGYSWNAIYNGLYHSDKSQVLGYQLVVAGAVVEKWRLTNVALASSSLKINYLGSLMGTDFDQPLKTTDSPTFDKLCIDSLLHKYPNFGSGNVNTLFTFPTLSESVSSGQTKTIESPVYTIQWSDYLNNINPVNFLSDMAVYAIVYGPDPAFLTLKIDIKINGVIVFSYTKNSSGSGSQYVYADDITINSEESATLQYIGTLTWVSSGGSTYQSGSVSASLNVERNLTSLEALSN